ncbi:cell division protein FtsQ [Urechidicola sp. KH5]
MKMKWHFIKGVFLLAFVATLYGFANYQNEQQVVKDVKVRFEEGENLFMSYQMVNKLLIQNNDTLQKKTKSLIDLNELEAQVLAHPMVENAKAYITVEGRLNFSIKQRTPIGRIVTNTNAVYIDRQGSLMPLSSNYSARVPLVTGVFNADDTNSLYELLIYIWGDDFWRKQIVGVHILPNDEYQLRTRVGNQKVTFGTLNKLEKKFENLKAFYSYAMHNETLKNYKELNLKYNQQVVATKIGV